MAGSVPLWYRRTYRLPPNDPRFESTSVFEMEVEFWAWHFDDLVKAGKDIVDHEDDDFDEEAIAAAMESDDWLEIINSQDQTGSES